MGGFSNDTLEKSQYTLNTHWLPLRPPNVFELARRAMGGKHNMAISKNTVCLMFDKEAEQAARFYAETFPNSSVGKVHRAPADYPSEKTGDVLTVEFTVLGIPCIGVNGGQESMCGWCKDKWGVSWQITPRTLTEAMTKGGEEAKRAFAAMMKMKKIDVALIDAARRGD